MPRLVVRKSVLSTTHFCRFFPVNTSKTSKRKSNEDSYRSRTRERNTTSVANPADEVGCRRRICYSKCRRSRFILIFVIVLVFFLSFFKFASISLEPDAPYLSSDTEEELSRPQLVADLDPVVLPFPATPKKGQEPNRMMLYRLAQPNCDAILKGQEQEIYQVEEMLFKEGSIAVPNDFFIEATQNCSHFRVLRNYPQAPYSDYDAQTPLAYLLGVKSSAELVERLLRAVYAPQNVYCLYSLRPSTRFPESSLGRAIYQISTCFSNVVVAYDPDVDKVLKSTVNAPYKACIDALLGYPKWRIALLIAEGDFPLKPHHEIITATRKSVANWRLKRKLDLPPLGIKNDFSGYVITRKMAEISLGQLANANLTNSNAGRQRALVSKRTQFFSDLKIRFDSPCLLAQECLITSSDLHWVVGQSPLFARRFDLAVDYVAIGCLEEMLTKQNRPPKNLSDT